MRTLIILRTNQDLGSYILQLRVDIQKHSVWMMWIVLDPLVRSRYIMI